MKARHSNTKTACRAGFASCCAISRVLLALVTATLVSCTSMSSTFTATVGELGGSVQSAMIRGGEMVRTDLMSRYVDMVRFLRVDDHRLASTDKIGAVEVPAGQHEIEVYYSWDHGSQRGLAPALVDYALAQAEVRRVLRFDAQPGETYTVQAEPKFQGERRDITTLSHVEFWVEDQAGTVVASADSRRAAQPVYRR